MESINPATGELIKSYEETSWAEAEAMTRVASETQRNWRRSEFGERAARLRKLAEALREGRGEYARLMTLEMGKPITQGRGEIDKCAWVCEYFAEYGENELMREPVKTEYSSSFVTFQPLGVILAIMPWNFPFWQVLRCAAPALMAGNAILLKHASNVPGCALAIEELFRKEAFPEGLFRTALMPSKSAERLIDHPEVKAVTLTGSVEAGRSVAARAGANLKKTVLELGGSDPYVVLGDCDLESAVETCVKSRLLNSGQSCIAAKRFIVVESVRQEFEERFVARMSAEKPGDPLDEKTTLGPLARNDLRDALHDQVNRSVEEGARLLLGGKIPEGKGAFYPPTVLADVRKGTTAYSEETFGPVAAIIPVADEAEAIRTANDSSFGLGAAVFSRDRQRAEEIAATEIEAGNCFVNDFVKSDPRLPFGGIKDSGYGRELSRFGIREFVNIKTVCVR
jgi:succinate-semialdehyde dehydrogenase/glutarate-semialdehyde dehydrogenase